MTVRRAACGLIFIGMLSACTTPGTPPQPAAATAPAPDQAGASPPTSPAQIDEIYRAAAAQGRQVLRIDAQRSLIAIVVRRGGTLARLGHDHVVASRTVAGYVAPQLGRADFHFRLDQMSVDEAGLRNEAGFDTQPSDDAIAGTRHNMLARVLDADTFPLALISVHGQGEGQGQDHIPAGGGERQFSVAITLHGVTRTLPIAVRLDPGVGPDGARTLSAAGTVNLKQTDFGLVPFAVLGGAIAVQDQMELRFKIVAVAAAAAR